MEVEKLYYRDIAKRLGITVDAARMKAKREGKAGRWRLIPGNHPNDPVTVEVPVGSLVAIERTADDVPIAPRNDAAAAWQAFANDQAARIASLTNELIAEKEAHGRTTCELTAAETRELGTVEELRRALAEIEELRSRIRLRRWIKGA